MTFSNNKDVIKPIEHIMMTSRENTVNYMTPLRLAHLMKTDHHYRPTP